MTEIETTTANRLVQTQTGLKLRLAGEGDGAWKTFTHASPAKGRPWEGLPAMVTVNFTDDTVRFFNENDQIEILVE